MNGQYEVLSPWADVDPTPLRGISPRLDSLDGKTIGLFCNWKAAARPILSVVERRLKEKFPGLKFSWYEETNQHDVEIETRDRARFEEWVKGIDAAVTAHGD